MTILSVLDMLRIAKSPYAFAWIWTEMARALRCRMATNGAMAILSMRKDTC